VTKTVKGHYEDGSGRIAFMGWTFGKSQRRELMKGQKRVNKIYQGDMVMETLTKREEKKKKERRRKALVRDDIKTIFGAARPYRPLVGGWKKKRDGGVKSQAQKKRTQEVTIGKVGER